jgi:hypothetical protein
MKILIIGLVAGLVLSLSLSVNAGADEKYLKCTVFVGENMEIKLESVSNPAMTSIEIGKVHGVTYTASAVYDLVNVYAKINGVTVGNSGKNSASLDIFGNEDGPVTVSCELTNQTPF